MLTTPLGDGTSLDGDEVSAPYKPLAIGVLVFLLAIFSFGYLLSRKERAAETATIAAPILDARGNIATNKERTDKRTKQELAHLVGQQNTITDDTSGCLTFDQIVTFAGSSATSMPGCIDLVGGQTVIGPLEVRRGTMENGIFDFARIEVPGKGERWTFLANLAK